MNKNKPVELRVFDFDGTLVMSPYDTTLIDDKPARQVYDEWLESEGFPPRKWHGWWGRVETLMPPIFGKKENKGELIPPSENLNEELASLVKEFQNDKNSLNVLMTGRHIKMRHPSGEHICKVILDAYGLSFDRYYYVSAGHPTIKFKCEKIQSMLSEFPSIMNIEIWEDRESHVSIFWDLVKYLKKEGKIRKGIVHQVYR